MTLLEQSFWFWLLSALSAALFSILLFFMLPALLFVRLLDKN